MTQQSESQYEDDLTMGMDGEKSFASDSIDILGFGSGDTDSPIARLKTIILSIDWEINDDILQQLDDELHELGELWADDKIKQVYVQGLSKIGKYIYKEKAGAHPNSINLLITFYHNLEKIVTNEDSMSEDEKKQLLLADVEKFDQLKSQIGKPAESTKSQEPSRPATVTVATEEAAPVAVFNKEPDDILELKTLKAQILGLDWEINNIEIEKLGNEVKRLESVFSQSKAKLILLQGIGALSSYINKKRSKSNSGAFTLLHSFYVSLEKISGTDLAPAEEKALLLEQVSKFNTFKKEISKEKKSSDSVVDKVDSPSEGSPATLSASPASFSGEVPAKNVGEESDDAAVAADVTSRLSSVFGEEQETDETYEDIDREDALEGVNVETEADDDSGEEALPYHDGSIAPALAEVEENSSFSVEKLADDLSVAPPSRKVEAIVGDDIEKEEDFTLEVVDKPTCDVSDELSNEDMPETEEMLQGVDVETEADDDSDEEALPMEAGELAPALSGASDEVGFNVESMAGEFDKTDTEAIENRLGSFFDDEVASSSKGWGSETPEQVVVSGEDERVNTDVDDVIFAALSDVEDKSFETEENNDKIVDQESTATDELIFDEANELEKVDAIEETEDNEIVFEDDDSTPAAMSDDESNIFAEETVDNKEDNESVESSVENELSFLDEDVDEGPDRVFTEDDDTEIESDTDRSLSFLDDDTATFTDSSTEDSAVAELFDTDDEPEIQTIESDFKEADPIAVETESETADEDVFSFFDDAEETVEETVEQADDEIVFEVEVEDIDEDDEIEFTVPGDDIGPDRAVISELGDVEEDVEFALPGELATPAAIAGVAAAVSTVSEIEIIDSSGTDSVIDDEEVVFEAVGDDVELDLLPGEVFDDSPVVDEDLDLPDDSSEEFVKFEAIQEGQDTGRYESLGILVTNVCANITDDGIQDLLSEVNKLRVSQDTCYSDKTFLQLLSTITQFIDKNKEDSRALKLMEDIVTGLEMSDSSKVSDEAVQEKLFTCTSQILLLQSQDIIIPVVKPDEVIVSITEPENDTELGVCADDRESEQVDTESRKFVLSGEDEQLASFVQKELADIRKLFVEEIGSLRKELANKNS